MGRLMNKVIKISLIWIVVICAVAFFFYLSVGGPIKKIDFAGLLFFILLISIIVPIALLIYFVFKLPLYIRTIKMGRLAKKCNLNFSGTRCLFNLKQPLFEKINVISGYVNGHKIIVYDFILGAGSRMSSSRYYTFFIKDGQKPDMIEGLIWGFPKIRIIEKWLIALQNGKDYKFRNSYGFKIFARFITAIIILGLVTAIIIFGYKK